MEGANEVMRKAIVIEYIESCGECPFQRYINPEPYNICSKLSQEETLPFKYVEVERSKNVRVDCPLPEA